MLQETVGEKKANNKAQTATAKCQNQTKQKMKNKSQSPSCVAEAV